MEVELKDDLLMGAKAVAEFVGISERQVYHMLARRQLPGFKIGNTVAAQKSTIIKHIRK